MSSDKVNEFIQHCVKLNFPPSAIPDQDYLRKIFQSRHCPVLENFVERVKHKKEIDHLRKNLLVSSVNSGQFQKQLNVIKIRQVKAKLEEVKLKNNQYRLKEPKLNQILEEKELKLNKLKRENDDIKVSIAVLESKVEQSERKLKIEKEFEQNIAKSMPVVGASQRDAETLELCKQKLAYFYQSQHDDEEEESKNTQKTIEGLMKTLANSTIFENFMKSIHNYQKQIDDLASNLKHVQDGKSFAALTMQLIMQLNYELARRGIRAIELKKKIDVAKEMCNENVENFSKNVIACLSQFDIEFIEDEEEFGEYLEEFLSAVIANFKAKGANKRAKELLDELNSTANVHAKNDRFATIRLQIDDIVAFTSGELTKFEEKQAQIQKIIDKINLLKLSTCQKIHNIQSSSQMNDLNRTMAGVKFDDGKAELSVNQKEFTTFQNIAIEQFKVPSIHSTLTDSLPVETTELIRKTNCDSSSINKFLDSLQNILETHTKFMEIAQIREPSYTIVNDMSSIERISEQIESNRDEISERIDKTSQANDEIRHQLQISRRIYDHMRTNPLAAYVPKTMTLQGKTYAEYVKDIEMYIRAIKH